MAPYLHIAALLHRERDADQVVAAAAEAGVRVEPVNRDAMDARSPNGLIFGLDLIPTHLIAQSIAQLARLLG